MRVIVTGGGGFIGSHIVDALIEHGHTVFVVDNLSEGNTENLNRHARMFDVNINDSDGLQRAFAEAKPDVVSHNAAQVSVRNSMSDPAHDAEVNIIGSLNVLQCAVEHDVERLLFASSSAVYSKPQNLPMDEIIPKCRNRSMASPSSAWKTSYGYTGTLTASGTRYSATAMSSGRARTLTAKRA